MNDRYLLLINAYAQRDHNALLIAGLAAWILIVDLVLAKYPRFQSWYRIYILAAWVGGIIYAFLGGTL